MNERLENSTFDNDESISSIISNGHRRFPDEDMETYNSSTSFTKSVKDYCQNIYYMTEIIISFSFALLGHDAPNFLFRMKVFERDIPYQVTDNGDVVLDSYINRGYVEQETVSDWQLIVFCSLVPFLLILFYSAVYGYRNDLHASACAYLFGTGSTAFITNCVKLYCGYWRPNFYNYCDFNAENLDCEAEDEGALTDSRKSFPSGHSSTAFFGMTFLTIFFIGKVGLYRGLSVAESSLMNETVQAYLFKKRLFTILASFPMLFATFVASSRVHDDWHHPADIVAGSIIGIICSSFAYGIWYSPISSTFSGYSILTACDIVKNQNL